MRRTRAFMLVLALFLMMAVVVMAMAFIGTRSLRYQEATRSVAYRKALALARAGLEDARVKLEKDSTFPPAGGLEQEVFTYQEALTDLSNGPKVGTYTVTVDTTWRQQPFGIVVVTVAGCLGDATAPEAQARVCAEIDVCPTNRVTNVGVNPNLYQVIRWSEEGNL